MAIAEKRIQVNVPLSIFTQMMGQLDPQDMLELREWLDEKLAEHEDELMLANPQIMSEIREARAEYGAGQYVTLEELRRELAGSEDSNV